MSEERAECAPTCPKVARSVERKQSELGKVERANEGVLLAVSPRFVYPSRQVARCCRAKPETTTLPAYERPFHPQVRKFPATRSNFPAELFILTRTTTSPSVILADDITSSSERNHARESPPNRFLPSASILNRKSHISRRSRGITTSRGLDARANCISISASAV